MSIDITDWLKPIRDDAPCGDDVSFSDAFDRIREARRADDPTLSQGEWEHELKVANWRQVIQLAGTVLAEQSKDLQAAVWLGEALIAQHHLAGAEAAFELLARLQQDYWDGLYPLADDGDLEERAAKLAWFSDYGIRALLALRVTPGDGGYRLADWQVSREVDNLARQDAEAHQEALDEGKPTGEMFDKAVESNPDAVLLEYHDAAARVLEAFQRFKAATDEKLGRSGPNLTAMDTAIKRFQQVVARAAKARGLIGDQAGDTEEQSGEVEVATGAGFGGFSPGGGDAANKAAALRTVSEIAAWFKRVEPHSPVSYLLQRAVAWADTPLDEWLAEVLADDGALSRVRSRIGLPD
ncbi:type VI secretion system protein TssA [Pseudoxanthomonas suwonensis]|uniref:ImpA N-terminal domain-containing protein n=1 Tax=Pseudoxanthomonas suwonensis TaxID=314722 RepID=A0A0E3ULY8_9GAMM|nr:type VI secretion system protein TssA [Pseudoxanthomonas suwonensis]AKC85911.1 hypothetical protein WQ53_03190 [Pseudoxanthomonas suwonensis]